MGAKEKNGFAQVDGLDEGHIVGLKKNFWDMAHNPQKVSVPLVSESQVHEEEVNGAWVLVAEVPRADYRVRPVYLVPLKLPAKLKR